MAIGRKDLRTDTERLMDRARKRAINQHDNRERQEQMATQRKMVKAINGMDRETKRARPGPAVSPFGNPDLLTDHQLKEIAEILRRIDQYDWRSHARADQLPPEGDWKIWMMLCGRGFGKTRAGAEYVREECLKNPGIVVAAIAKDHRALRDVILEGESGLVACTPPEHIKKIHRGLGDVSVEFTNGSKVICYTAGEPDAVRGQSFSMVWADEFSSWPRNKADEMLEQARMCLRRSTTGARAIITTTPKRLPHVIDMVKLADDPEEQIVITRGTSRDNPMLTAEWHRMMERKYAGTRLGRQELLGELVMDVDNCLFTGDMIEAAQWPSDDKLPLLVGILTGVDPSGSSDGDATGIVTIGWTKDKTLYVLENKSTNGTPDHRYSEVCRSMHRWGATEAWVEAAYGGDHGVYGVQQQWMALQRSGEIPEDKKCPRVQLSTIKGDKAARAMPVVALLEQQMNNPDVRRVWFDVPGEGNGIAALIDELLGWDTTSKKSPNAMDALVHACRQAMRKLGLEAATISSPASPHSTRRLNRGFNPYGR